MKACWGGGLSKTSGVGASLNVSTRVSQRPLLSKWHYNAITMWLNSFVSSFGAFFLRYCSKQQECVTGNEGREKFHYCNWHFCCSIHDREHVANLDVLRRGGLIWSFDMLHDDLLLDCPIVLNAGASLNTSLQINPCLQLHNHVTLTKKKRYETTLKCSLENSCHFINKVCMQWS